MRQILVCVLFVVFLCCALTAVEGGNVDKNCIVDKELPWDAEGNYMDCKSKENKKTGNTDCCDRDGSIGCCNNGDKWAEMKKIAIGVGVATFCLCVLVFVIVWCNPKTFPCMTTCKNKMQEKYERFEEKSGCCKKRVERRRLERQQEHIPQYEVPDEMKVTVKDDFWYINPY